LKREQAGNGRAKQVATGHVSVLARRREGAVSSLRMPWS
jgi:hypothetical protein